MRSPRFGVLRRLSLALLFLVSPALLSGQANQCGSGGGPGTVVETGAAGLLPVDRLADLLALEPGVTSLNQGDLSIRGSGPGAIANYVDGVPVNPGHRGSSALVGGSYFGEQGTGLAIGTNGFDRLFLFTGVAPAELGGGRGGALALSTDGPCVSRGPISASWGTDALFGKSNGLGFNRLTLNGDHRVGRFIFGGAAVLEGAQSERLGQDQNGSPIFLSAGVDTSVTFDNGGGTPVTVDVLRFKKSEGIRIPRSANSAYTLNAHVGYQIGGGHRVSLSAYASQNQDRQFDYQNLYNLNQTSAARMWSRMVTGSWTGPLKQGEGLQLRGEAMLSWQTDRITGGPLTLSGEEDTRDPFGGFLISPLDFRFTTDNFAVDDELVNNFRVNDGRLSPYDIKNPDQYSLIDVYRNNAYGLTGFSEAGGPVGWVTLSKENRLVAKGVVDASFARLHRLRVGAEVTSYDVDFYQSQLTSQAGANAYIESPSHLAIFGDYSLKSGPLEAGAGLRYDRFKSGASRPEFPRISSAPGFDPANPTAGFIKDQAHSQVSPSVQVAYQATPMIRFTGGIAKTAQLPDFAAVFAGINTDITTTSVNTIYGSDLDLERATIGQLGARVQLTPRLTGDASVFYRKDEDLVATRLVSLIDPTKNSFADIFFFKNAEELKTTGLDLRLSQKIGSSSRAWLSYTFSDANLEDFGPDVSSTLSRPHTLAGAVLYQTESGLTALGGILRDVGVYGAFRVASGTAFTKCAAFPGNESAFSDGPQCPAGILGEFNAERLPALKLLDLKVSKGFNLGSTQLIAFVDARNLFNTRNVIRVFGQTGKTSNSTDLAVARNSGLSELSNESDANGVRQPDGTIDLSFGGAQDPRAGCGGWTRGGAPSVPNCIYLINAEEQFGNGDHLFTTVEQTRAIDALYNVSRGLQNFTGPGRRVRIGMEVRF